MSENQPPNSLDLPQEDDPKPEKVRLHTRFEAMTWSAPLPPPEVLAKYNEAFPGCSERIVSATEAQAKHRQHLETINVEGNVRSQDRGQWMAFILTLVILLGGFLLIYLNKDILGTVFIGSDIAATVGIFIYGKRDQRQQLRRKADAVKPHVGRSDEE